MNVLSAHQVSWFTYNTQTYVIGEVNTAEAGHDFTTADNVIIRLMGEHDLHADNFDLGMSAPT